VELLAEVPDDVCRLLLVDTANRVAMIDRVTVSHIFDRRSFHDAALIVGMLARQAFNPVYCARDNSDSRSFFIAEPPFAGSAKWVSVVLKHVTARTSATGHDEIRVVTAHLVENSTLNRMLRGK
jgi:hypothetical protein